MEPKWSDLPKYIVIGSDKSIAMGPTTSRQTAIDHAAAMNRSNAEGDNRHWKIMNWNEVTPKMKLFSVTCASFPQDGSTLLQITKTKRF